MSSTLRVTEAEMDAVWKELLFDFQRLEEILQARVAKQSASESSASDKSVKASDTDIYIQAIDELRQKIKVTNSKLLSARGLPFASNNRPSLSEPSPLLTQGSGNALVENNSSRGYEFSSDGRDVSNLTSSSTPKCHTNTSTMTLPSPSDVPASEASIYIGWSQNTPNTGPPLPSSLSEPPASGSERITTSNARGLTPNPLYTGDTEPSWESVKRRSSMALSVFDQSAIHSNADSSYSGIQHDMGGSQGIRSVPLQFNMSPNCHRIPSQSSTKTVDTQPGTVVNLGGARTGPAFLSSDAFHDSLRKMLSTRTILPLKTLPESDWFLLSQVNDPSVNFLGPDTAGFNKKHGWKLRTTTGYLVVSLNVLLQYEFFNKSPMPDLPKFLRTVYRSHSIGNPFHNSLKSLEMLLTVHRALLRPETHSLLEDLDIAAVLLVALTRDTGNIGLSNTFLARICHPFTRLFGLLNPVERCSAALFSAILEETGGDWLMEMHPRLGISYRLMLIETVGFVIESSALPFNHETIASLSASIAARRKWGSSVVLPWLHRRAILTALVFCAHNSRIFKPTPEYCWWINNRYLEWRIQRQLEDAVNADLPYAFTDLVGVIKFDLHVHQHKVMPIVELLSDLLPPVWSIMMHETFKNSLSPSISPDNAALLLSDPVFPASSALSEETSDRHQKLRKTQKQLSTGPGESMKIPLWVDESKTLLSPFRKSAGYKGVQTESLN